MTGFVVVEVPRRCEAVMPDPCIAALGRVEVDDRRHARLRVEARAEQAWRRPFNRA